MKLNKLIAGDQIIISCTVLYILPVHRFAYAWHHHLQAVTVATAGTSIAGTNMSTFVAYPPKILHPALPNTYTNGHKNITVNNDSDKLASLPIRNNLNAQF